MQLLIADDEPAILAVLRAFFVHKGYQVLTAGDGQEAIDQAVRHRPDLIILDIQMPRKSGIEAVRELRQIPELADTPILALTAHIRDYTPVDVQKAGFTMLLTKPFEFVELGDIVARLTSGKT